MLRSSHLPWYESHEGPCTVHVSILCGSWVSGCGCFAPPTRLGTGQSKQFAFWMFPPSVFLGSGGCGCFAPPAWPETGHITKFQMCMFASYALGPSGCGCFALPAGPGGQYMFNLLCTMDISMLGSEVWWVWMLRSSHLPWCESHEGSCPRKVYCLRVLG